LHFVGFASNTRWVPGVKKMNVPSERVSFASCSSLCVKVSMWVTIQPDFGSSCFKFSAVYEQVSLASISVRQPPYLR
jgi:hypothetical protein